MKRTLFVLAFGSLSALSHAVLIDFEDQPSNTVITTQYSAVATFSSEAGAENVAFFFNATNGNILCTRPIGGGINCLEDTYINFTNPVSGLEFDAIEPNFNGVDATFHIFHSGGMSTEFLTGLGGSGNEHVNLSSYVGVTRLEIVDILDDPVNENGIGWDNFAFTPVPEPTTVAVVGIGLALLARRRR